MRESLVRELGGGTITIAAGATLHIRYRTTTFASDIAFQGQTPTCSTCTLRTATGATLYNSATVTLLEGMRWSLSHGTNIGQLRVGNGASGGSLRTVGPPDANVNRWPQITSNAAGSMSFWISGGAGDRSHLDIDGLRLLFFPTSGNVGLRFVDHYEIDQFDHVLFDAEGTNTMTGSYIQIDSCANAVYNDVNWEEIDFMDAIYQPPTVPPAPPPPKTGRNVRIENCAGLGALHLYPRTSGSNLGFGSADAHDPDNVLVFH